MLVSEKKNSVPSPKCLCWMVGLKVLIGVNGNSKRNEVSMTSATWCCPGVHVSQGFSALHLLQIPYCWHAFFLIYGFFVVVLVVFVFNSCNVWTENPLENDKASFLPAFVTRLIISFLIVYSFEAPCLNGKKIHVLIGAACFPLPGQNKTPWLGKISRYLIKYKLHLCDGPGKGIASPYIMHSWATLFLKAAYAIISPAFLLGLWINTA